MSDAIVIMNGVTYTGDPVGRTILPLDEHSRLVLAVMDDNELCGPQIDEWAGLHAGWQNYPASMIAVFGDLADATPGLEVTWRSGRGDLPPKPAAQGA